MAAVARRPVRRTHLDASVTPAEHALRERARVLNEMADQATPDSSTPFPPVVTGPEFVGLTRFIAEQLNALAEELHYW